MQRQTEYWGTVMMLHCIKFPVQQAAPDWPMWAPENTIFSLLNCGAKLVAAEEAGQSSPVIWLDIPHQSNWKALLSLPTQSSQNSPRMKSLKTHSVIPDKWLPALSNHTFT